MCAEGLTECLLADFRRDFFPRSNSIHGQGLFHFLPTTRALSKTWDLRCALSQTLTFSIRPILPSEVSAQHTDVVSPVTQKTAAHPLVSHSFIHQKILDCGVWSCSVCWWWSREQTGNGGAYKLPAVFNLLWKGHSSCDWYLHFLSDSYAHAPPDWAKHTITPTLRPFSTTLAPLSSCVLFVACCQSHISPP